MIFDIASNPGGVDFIAAEKLGIYAESYQSLPGKYAPQTSAEILFEAVKRIIGKE
jgi:dipicolinate synthase subunit A